MLQNKNFYILWLSSIIGALAILPCASAIIPTLILTPKLISIALIQAMLLWGIVVFCGMKASEAAGFKLITNDFQTHAIAVIAGISIGGLLKLLNNFVFTQHPTLQNIKVAPWKAALAPLYGGINEEVMCRLLLVSVITLLLQKIIKTERSYLVLSSVVIATLLFGAGHLPVLYAIIENPGINDVVRVLALNGIAGIAFGVLYWRYGLFTAILSHFAADIVVHLL